MRRNLESQAGLRALAGRMGAVGLLEPEDARSSVRPTHGRRRDAQITGGIRPSILNVYVRLRRETHSTRRAGSGHGALLSSPLGCPPSGKTDAVVVG
jgi:hypothetical protein